MYDDAVGISRGSFYYHFKTKDEILAALILRRLAKTRGLLRRWEEDGETPEARIRSFIHILIVNRRDIKRYGCPVGSLCTELANAFHGASFIKREVQEVCGWLGDRVREAASG